MRSFCYIPPVARGHVFGYNVWNSGRVSAGSCGERAKAARLEVTRTGKKTPARSLEYAGPQVREGALWEPIVRVPGMWTGARPVVSVAVPADEVSKRRLRGSLRCGMI